MISLLRSRILISLFSVLLLAGFAGCTHKTNTTAPNKNEGLFADRPDADTLDLYIVLLHSPPIMEVAKQVGGHWSVPEDAKNKILNEQAVFEQGLKAIAPDAQIIYRYQLVLNGVAVWSSTNVEEAILRLPGVSKVTMARKMSRPKALNKQMTEGAPFDVNSVEFIGANEAHKLGFTGTGIRVGIIDSGIDYTHAMLGGSGVAADFAAIDGAQPSKFFPNQKVAGGLDLVGADFNTSSNDVNLHLPHPDANPIDEGGHGSHVAGTIAGVGDNVNTYSGIAPDAKLYSMKVFGKEGSTSDASVIAAFEFSADPNGDLNPEDHLDVVNLSLGGNYGQPQNLYNVAVTNLSQSGTVVVAAAGNDGPVDYITGDPGTSTDALSVAASVDASPVNWKFHAVTFATPKDPKVVVKLIEGDVATPVAEAGNVTGPLVDIGLADQDLDAATKAALNGKVAYIKRGGVTFVEKLKRAADAGAIGAVVYNNAAGDPIAMGGNDTDPKFKFPAVMIPLSVGSDFAAQLKAGATITVQFLTDAIVEEPNNIDSITSFSSKGPRSEDNLIKPEIAAPGQNITSVKMGTGTEGVMFDGTSMATPHMTGVIALLKQAHPSLNAKELKALAMNTAKVLTQGNEDVPIVMQGAGRVQILEALTTPVVSETPSLSLGRIQLEKSQVEKRNITLRNLTDKALKLTTSTTASPGMSIQVKKNVNIPAHGQVIVPVTFTFSLKTPQIAIFELDGRIFFKQGDRTVAQIPALAIRTEASEVSTADSLSSGSLKLVNRSPNAGLAMAFTLIDQSKPKPAPTGTDTWMDRACDLQSVGYRIITKGGPQGSQQVIQFAFKIFKPVTTWYMCAVSVLVDAKGDGTITQELAGVTGGGFAGVLPGPDFGSVLIDYPKARDIRIAYEAAALADPKAADPDYSPSVLAKAPMQAYQQSTIAVVEAPLAALALDAKGQLNLQFAAQSQSGQSTVPDKYLGDGDFGSWYTLSPKEEDQVYFGMDELTVVSGSGASLSLTKGNTQGPLVLYYPLNASRVHGGDGQQQIIGH